MAYIRTAANEEVPEGLTIPEGGRLVDVAINLNEVQDNVHYLLHQFDGLFDAAIRPYGGNVDEMMAEAQRIGGVIAQAFNKEMNEKTAGAGYIALLLLLGAEGEILKRNSIAMAKAMESASKQQVA